MRAITQVSFPATKQLIPSPSQHPSVSQVCLLVSAHGLHEGAARSPHSSFGFLLFGADLDPQWQQTKLHLALLSS